MLFFAALMLTLGVKAQTASDYYTFEAEVLLDASQRLTSQASLTAGKHIVIQHCHEGTEHAGHEGAYISFYSLATNGKHKVYMQENPVGLVIYTTEAGAVANRFKLQTSHMRCKEGAHDCYLQEPDQTGELSAGNTSFDFQFKYVSDGKWQIVVPGYSTYYDGYLWVDTEAGKNPTIGVFTVGTAEQQAQSYFYVYEVNPATDTRGTIQYVENATVRLTGPSGNQITTTHTGWSDFYEFTMYSWERYNGTNYGVSISNVLYHSDANLITADISYPFAISGDVAKVPVHLCPNGNTTRLAVVDGTTLKTLNKNTASAELWTKNNGNQWYIYPKYVVGDVVGNNDFYYAIQNVDTKQYLRYSSETGSISLYEASDAATVATLPDDCFFKLNGSSDGKQIYFMFKRYYNGIYYDYYLYGNGDNVSSYSSTTTGTKFNVPNVVAEELDGEVAIGFTRYFHEDTYFWDGGVVPTADVPDAVKAVLENTSHEDRDNGTHNVYTATTGITVTQPGQVNATFNYTSGANALQILGVDIVTADGAIISSDYHPGKAGNPSQNNQYILTNVAAGDYHLRYWVCSYTKTAYEGHDLAKVRGRIDVDGANYRWIPATTLDTETATWYRMRLSDDLKRYISAQDAYIDEDCNLILTNDTPPTDYAGLWTMVGNKTDGYKFYNYTAGAEYALKTVGEGANARTYLAPVAEASLYDVVQEDGNYQFFVKLHGTDNYLYKQGDYLATKNDANTLGDANAVLSIETVNSTTWTNEEIKIGSGDDTGDDDNTEEGGDDNTVTNVTNDVTDAYLASGLYTMGVDENQKRGYVGASADWADYPVLCDISWNDYKQNSATAMENGKTWFVLAIDQDSYVFYNMGNGKYLVNSTGTSSGVVNFGDTPYIWNLSKNGNYTLVRDPWHGNNSLSGGCGRAPGERPMAWEGDNTNYTDGGLKFTLTSVENTAWNLEALKTQIMDALVQDLPLTLTYNQGTGTLTSSCRGINQADKVQTLLETFAFTGYTGATLGEIGFAQDGLTATVTFPFAVQTPVMFGAFNDNVNLWFADDNGVHVVKNSLPTYSTDANYQWKLIPQLAGKELTFAIQNVGTGKYVLSNVTESNHDKGAVTLADAGTQFIPNNAGKQFQVNGQTLYLSLNSSSTADQWIGIHTSTHGGTTHNITSVEFATADDLAEAKAMVEVGVGYPKTTSKEYKELNALTETNSKSAVSGTLNAYYACTDVNMPENGKAYKINAWWRNRTWPLIFIENRPDGYACQTPAYVPVENAEPAVFVCREVAEGEYAFITDNGYYFGWQAADKGNNTSKDYQVINNNKDTQNKFKLAKAVIADNGAGPKLTNKELFGKFNLYGQRDNEWWHYMFNLDTKNFHDSGSGVGAGKAYYGNDAHTVYYTLEEVSTYTLNQVKLTPTSKAKDTLLKGIEDGQTVSTFSAPYATVIPAGVTAYYAKKASQGETLYLTAVETDKALPASQGVILIGNVDVTAGTFVPATTETLADLSANVLANTAKRDEIAGDYDYALAKGGEGIGIYKVKEGTKIKAGKAYLHFDTPSQARSFVLSFSGAPTAIEDSLTDTADAERPVIYDLYGRRVNETIKGGIYIVNGKKVFIK